MISPGDIMVVKEGVWAIWDADGGHPSGVPSSVEEGQMLFVISVSIESSYVCVLGSDVVGYVNVKGLVKA